MKIAFISFEYPPDTAYGGIATYVHEAARMLSKRGHRVEVFTASPYRSGTEAVDGLLVHRVCEKDHKGFSGPIGRLFARRHTEVQFDVLEGPEYGADAREAIRLVPDIPLVVKLHTPSIVLLKLNYLESSFLGKLRLYLEAICRRRRPAWGYDIRFQGARLHLLKCDEIERSHALEADEIAGPSRSIGIMVRKIWGLEPEKVSHVPYPFIPSENLLRIPVETQTNVVTFVGRLEVRKGVLDLARAIPIVLRHYPETKFRFVGAADSSPQPNTDMQQYLVGMLGPYLGSVEFTGPLPYDKIPDVLGGTDICVFPSIWENFPCVCLEAMAAGRGIVASNAGGMTDMLNGGDVGLLVPPRNPKRIAEALMRVLTDSELRMRLGQAARERVLAEYSTHRVGPLQEASYARAMSRRRTLGPRPRNVSYATTGFAEKSRHAAIPSQ